MCFKGNCKLANIDAADVLVRNRLLISTIMIKIVLKFARIHIPEGYTFMSRNKQL